MNKQRTAIQDGNAGYVSEPSVVHTSAKQVGVNKTRSPDSIIVENALTGLGEAFSGYIKEETANMQEQQRLAGVAKAGMKRSMDEVDVDVKQSKFTDYIFGEDVEYRAAQQQVITNGVEAQYRTELANIDKYEGYTEREYGDLLKGSLDAIADQHKNDPETKRLATDAWIQASGKLVAAQHKTHFAYKQTVMREISHDTTMGRINQLVIEEGEVTSPQDIKDYQAGWKAVLDPSVRPRGMTEKAHRSQLFEIANERLAAGNITMYKQGIKSGFWKDATPEVLAARDKAMAKYDTKFAFRVDTSVEEVITAGMAATSIEDLTAILDVAETTIKQHETRQTGSDKSVNTIANARTRLAKQLKAMFKSTATAAQDEADILSAAAALKLDGFKRGAELEKFTKKTIDAAYNHSLVEDVSEEGENLSPQEAATRVIDNTDAGAKYVSQWTEGKHLPPAIVGGLHTALDSIQGTQDKETGMIGDRLRRAMSFMSLLDEKSNTQLQKELGSTYAKFKFMEGAVRANVPAVEMVKQWDTIQEAISSGIAGDTAQLGEGVDLRTTVLDSLGMGNANVAAGTKVMSWYHTGLSLFGQDHTRALQYAKQGKLSDTLLVGNGVMIENVSTFRGNLTSKNGSDYVLEEVFGFLNNSVEGVDLVKGLVGEVEQGQRRDIFGRLFGEKEQPYQLGAIKGLKIEITADGTGFTMQAQGGRARLLGDTELQAIVQAMDVRKEQQKIAADVAAAINLNKFRHGQKMRNKRVEQRNGGS